MYGQVSFGSAADRDPLARLRQNLLTVRPDADFRLLRGRTRWPPTVTRVSSAKAATLTFLIRSWWPRSWLGLALMIRRCVRRSCTTLWRTPRSPSRRCGGDSAARWPRWWPRSWSWIAWGHGAGSRVAEALALIGSADRRVATVKLADRLHNMQTVEFLPLLKQVRKARESLDVFAPAAEELRMPTVGSELQSLAFSTLIRALPARRSAQRTIVALDIERSTSRTRCGQDGSCGSCCTSCSRRRCGRRGFIRMTVIRSKIAGTGCWPLSIAVDSPLADRIVLGSLSCSPAITPELDLSISCGSGWWCTRVRCTTTGTGVSGWRWILRSGCWTRPKASGFWPARWGRCCWSCPRMSALGRGRGRISVDVGGQRRWGWISLP